MYLISVETKEENDLLVEYVEAQGKCNIVLKIPNEEALMFKK
jgi:hypothetical protein